MKKIFTIYKIVLYALFLTQLYSCSPPLYFPNGINAPLFSKKGQFTMNVATDGNCTDIQLATSTSDKFGLILNANFGSLSGVVTSTYSMNISSGSNSYSSSSPYGHQHSFYEGGAGLYNKIGNNGRSETFVLAGFGSATSYSSNNKRSCNYARFAIQSDIGIVTNSFEGIMSCRIGYLNIYNLHSNEFSANPYYSNPDLSSFFVDPAITLRVGFKGFKIFSQYGISIPFNNQNADWNPGWCTIGLIARFQ